jgi:fluoroquinolone transport system permease protein
VSRLRAVVALEQTVEWRYRIPAVAIVVTAVWTVVLLVLPAPVAHGAGPVVLVVDTATFGAFFVAALVLFERGEGALAALTVSPVRFGEYLGAKVGVLTGLSVVSAIPVALAAGTPLAAALLGVALLAALFLTLSFALVLRQPSLTAFLTVAPLPLVPLIAAPLAHVTGLLDHPLLFLVPTTAAADLIQGGVAPLGIGYLLVTIAAAIALARSRFTHEPGTGRERRRHRTRWRPRGWLAALAGIDRRTSVRSALVMIVLAGPLVLAVALRLGYPPLAEYLRDRFDVDLAPYQPILLAALIVLHVPLITGMVGALLVLDDIDDRTLLVLRVSPVGVRRYLAYRTVTVAVAALVLLLVAVPVSGLASGLPVPALVLAAAQAPLITLATAAVAGNKVEGLAWLKLLALVPTAIAPAVWWLPEPAQWPLRVVPHYWTVDMLWRPGWFGLLAGATLTALATALLTRLVQARTK